MRVGLYVPNGVQGEFRGWDPLRAWERSLEVGRLAETLGFESLRVPDHLQNVRAHDDAPTFEPFVHLTALARETGRVRLGPGVVCAGFRNPALLSKMAATLDVASGGRTELGIGAGWNEWEWRGYGYGFPPTAERLQRLREALEVVTRMLEPGRATWHGEQIHVEDAVCEPKGAQQPRIPIIVGGNGPKVTWRLAARFADELNLSDPTVDQIAEWLPVIRQRCEEIGRDPATLPVSAEMFWHGTTGGPRIETLQRVSQLGLVRIHSNFAESADSDEPLHAFAEDCRAAGLELAT
jgi:F420-dependent oxidoreductase-like protein